MNQIDVHVLLKEDDNKEWWELCRQSLENHPINIHYLDAIEGDQWTARLNGFRSGKAPYISFVDPDDIVMPDTFKQCLQVLKDNPNVGGVFTNSEIIDDNGEVVKPRLIDSEEQWTLEKHFQLPVPIHQIAVMRRDIFEQAVQSIGKPINIFGFVEYMIFSYVGAIAPWYFLDINGYQWRRHEDGTHHHLTSKERKAVREQIKKLLNVSE